jgi:hypothetical protein
MILKNALGVLMINILVDAGGWPHGSQRVNTTTVEDR